MEATASSPAKTHQDPATPTPPPLDWTDRAAVEAWARTLCMHVYNALHAGEDATRPPGKREFGRRAARRAIRQAEKSVAWSLACAGIDPKNV